MADSIELVSNHDAGTDAHAWEVLQLQALVAPGDTSVFAATPSTISVANCLADY